MKVMKAENTEAQKPFRVSTPWGPISAILITVLAFLGSQIVGSLSVNIYPHLLGWDKTRADSWLKNSTWAQFFYIFIADVMVLLIIWLFLRHRKARASMIGIKRPHWVDVAYALSGFFVYMLVYLVLFNIVTAIIPSLDTNQKQELGYDTYTSGLALAGIFVSLVVLPPLVEETLFRGFLYSGLRSKIPKIAAAIVTSIIFAVMHLQFGSGNALLWVAALDTFVLSMVLVYLRDKTDSLWASIGLHMIKNLLAFFSIFIFHAV
ncbi:MAG: CPBP family intramembrane glutamic endopeptidase [Candidatus Saccharibacteria bacterium]